MKKQLIFLFICVIVYACREPQQQADTKDPYLWLEEIEGAKSLEWIEAQNAASEKVIQNQPEYEPLKKRFLETFNDDDKIAYPSVVGSYVYNLLQDETNERGIWRRMPLADYVAKKAAWEVVLDLDVLSAKENKKWVFQGAEWLAPGYTRCLLTLSDGGKDESVIREFDAASKDFVKGGFNAPESKGGAGWIDANTLLISSDYGAGGLTPSGYPRIIKKWRRDTPLEAAETIYKADSTVVGVWPLTFNSGGKQFTFVYTGVSAFQSQLQYLTGGELIKVAYPQDAEYHGFHKGQLIFALQSDWQVNGQTFASGSLVSLDLDKTGSGEYDVKSIYEPDAKSSFVSMSSSRDFIVVNTMQNVQNKLIRFTLENGAWKSDAIDTPAFGSIFLISASNDSNDYFFQYSNLISPSTLIHGDETGTAELKQLHPVFASDYLVIDQNEATSKDGTTIPYFIVHSKDMPLNGKNPTLVYAYGGFNVSSQPYYSSTRGIGWMERGGVYVLANIRGGGEFGPSWHMAAMKEHRQNAYDDFYAVTEDLIQRKITSPEYLGAFGWSNGGLLAGVVLTQHPEMYNAVVVGAPLLDMKRYSKMLAGASWMEEFGDPDKPEDWAYLKKYSPYQNVMEETDYPEALFVTSIKDDRVHPGHARKMAAKMMDMGHPVLYYETIEGGHGAASTNKQQAEMWATVYTYLNMKLNEVHTNSPLP